MGRRAPGDMVPDSCSLFGFWLVPENVCVFLPNKSAAVLGVAKYMKFSCSPCISRLFTMSEHDIREIFRRYHNRSLCKSLWKYSLTYWCVLDTGRSIFWKAYWQGGPEWAWLFILKLLHLFHDFLDHVLVVTKTLAILGIFLLWQVCWVTCNHTYNVSTRLSFCARKWKPRLGIFP